jgi:Fe-S-cluster containining protein
VSPYEIARIAAALAISTTEVLARYTIEGGTVLRQREDGGCSLLAGKGCGVHPGRPLVCRLYPLGRVIAKDGSESFVQLRGHPQTEGVLGENGTIGEFLESQGAAPYLAASARYFVLFSRLIAVLRARPEGPDTFRGVVSHGAPESDALEWLDIDATLARRARSEIPSDVEARVALHLSLLECEIAAIESAG